MPCLPPETLAAYQEGGLPDAERQALADHAAACGACRRALLLLAASREPSYGEEPTPVSAKTLARLSRPAPAFWPRAAAAALLLAVGSGWAVSRQSSDPATVTPPGLSGTPDFPAGTLGGPEACLAPGMDLVLQAGASVRSGAGRRLQAEAGSFWVEVSSGEPLTLDLPGATLVLRRGALALTLPPKQAAWALREAFAEEGPGVRVLQGEVEIAGRRVPAPRQLTLKGKDWEEAPLPEAEIAASLRARALAVAAVPGRDPAGTPARYRWAVVLSGRRASTDVGLSFPIEGNWHTWVAGLATLPPTEPEILELAWDGERVTGRVNGVLRFSADARQARELLRSAEPGWDVPVWGGTATVVRSTLHKER